MKKKLLPTVIKQFNKIVSGKVLYTNLYPDTFYENIKKEVDVILSPEFYWIYKIDNLNLSKKEALELAKTSFEFDNISYYNFYIFKLETFYLVFAIEKNLNLKIDKKYIKNIYLSQIEFFEFNNIQVNNNFIFSKINDIFYLVPKKFNAKTVEIEEVLKDLKLSNNKINIQDFSLKKNELNIGIFFLVILNLYIFLNSNIYNKKLNFAISEKKSLSNQYKLPETLLELNTIKEDYLNKLNNKNKFLNDLNYILKVPLNKNNNDVFIKLNSDYKQLFFDLDLLTQKNFHNYFNSKFRILNEQKNNNIYFVKVKDE